MESPIKWVGGKSNLAKTIVSLFPEHKGYIEVFGGAGWVLFEKEVSDWEVLNDLDNNLCNLWNVIKEYKEAFIDSFNYEVISRTIFNQYKEIYRNKKYKSNIERAHILYYLLKAGTAASLPDGGGSGFGRALDKSRLRLDKLPNDIENAHTRLLNVTIECKDFREILGFYDSSSTLFYLDPPYRNTARHPYPVGKFTDKDYTDLAMICTNIEGKFLLTINDDPFIKNLFSCFNIKSVGVSYNVSTSSSGRKKYPELIIKNY